MKLNFDAGFKGQAKTKSDLDLSIGSGGASPYELAMAGMVSCFYSTFMDIAVKKRLTWESVSVDIQWTKDLESSPTFLKEATLKLDVKIIEGKEAHFDKSFELASKYCSLYQTFSKVAELNWEASYN